MNERTKPVKVGDAWIGGDTFCLIAGPCSIENLEQFTTTAQAIKQQGAQVLRGGIFKLRTRAESFQGLGREALPLIREVKAMTGLPFVSEVTDPRQIEELSGFVDMFQVGSRNMHNYSLLKELGHTQKPVLLKRGFSGLVREWVEAAEYVHKGGNEQVVLCERGIRTFETITRNTLDLNAVAWLKANTHFPVIVDPSHGTGQTELVQPMTLAAAAAGADGVMIEVHPRPQEALSDGFQALDLEQFHKLTTSLNGVLQHLNRGGLTHADT